MRALYNWPSLSAVISNHYVRTQKTTLLANSGTFESIFFLSQIRFPFWLLNADLSPAIALFSTPHPHVILVLNDFCCYKSEQICTCRSCVLFILMVLPKSARVSNTGYWHKHHNVMFAHVYRTMYMWDEMRVAMVHTKYPFRSHSHRRKQTLENLTHGV